MFSWSVAPEGRFLVGRSQQQRRAFEALHNTRVARHVVQLVPSHGSEVVIRDSGPLHVEPVRFDYPQCPPCIVRAVVDVRCRESLPPAHLPHVLEEKGRAPLERRGRRGSSCTRCVRLAGLVVAFVTPLIARLVARLVATHFQERQQGGQRRTGICQSRAERAFVVEAPTTSNPIARI